jgi:hypothetical protein
MFQGYDNTLCSLTMKRPNCPLVPPERRRRPHVDAFADLAPIDESTLIQLLDAITDDDDIEWKTDPFEMRLDSANPETPDEIIDIFSTSVRSLPAQVDPMVNPLLTTTAYHILSSVLAEPQYFQRARAPILEISYLPSILYCFRWNF